MDDKGQGTQNQSWWVTALKVTGAIVVSLIVAFGAAVSITLVIMVGDDYARIEREKNESPSITQTPTQTPAQTPTQAPTQTPTRTTETVGEDGLTAAQRATLEELKLIQPVEIHDESNDWYSVFVGTLTNKSDRTHYFIKVKGEFTDYKGDTIDTDWTYACGDEGLRPGESTKFTLSVRRDDRITGISCYAYDFE